jgi:hypothetical protein
MTVFWHDTPLAARLRRLEDAAQEHGALAPAGCAAGRPAFSPSRRAPMVAAPAALAPPGA